MTRAAEQTEITYDVTYRADTEDGRRAVVRLRTTYGAATLADAWERLTALLGEVDPRTIEIELRRPAETGASRANPKPHEPVRPSGRPSVVLPKRSRARRFAVH